MSSGQRVDEMKASELISIISSMMDKHGDLDILCQAESAFYDIEGLDTFDNAPHAPQHPGYAKAEPAFSIELVWP